MWKRGKSWKHSTALIRYNVYWVRIIEVYHVSDDCTDRKGWPTYSEHEAEEEPCVES